MTPIPFDLPLRPNEATQVAELIFEHAEGKPLTEEVRNRLVARVAGLRLETLTPYFGSLARDPVHPSAYYLAVDGEDGAPLLLHLAASSAPTSSIFHKPVLIGRMRPERGPEVVINSVPFGPQDETYVERFAARIDPAFLPKPQGTRAAIAIAPRHPATDLPAAFQAWRKLLKRTGRNYAAIFVPRGYQAPREVYVAALWSAIRAGWREGYSIGIEIHPPLETAQEVIRQAAQFTTFVTPVPASAPCDAAAQIHEAIRQCRSLRKLGKAFDFELDFEGLAPAEIASCLDSLKNRGILVRPREGRLLAVTNDPSQIANLQ